MSEEKEMEQLYYRYEYLRSYRLSTERMKSEINKVRKNISNLLDDLEASVNNIMDSARCMEGGGVRCGKVWDLYPNNPEELGLQSTVDHIKHLKNSKYPFKKILDVLEGV